MSRAVVALNSLLILFLTSPVMAQSITGSVAGTVSDSSGLPFPGAAVTLHHAATNAVRNTQTNSTGAFYFGSLQPGEYAVVVEASGFKRLERRSIMLSAAEVLWVGELKLDIGALTESISVVAQGAAVQTQSAERAGVLTGTQVQSLAIRGRNIMTLLSLLPGVVDNAESENLVHNWDINVNGGRRNTNNVSLDGATLNAIGNQFNSVVSMSMDAVAEVRVLLSNYQAEFGRLSGANVHVVSKSGTREFHGLGSYWKRHEQFNANEFFNNRLGLDKPRYRFNVWNYNVGGPLYIPGKFNRDREKLFFFWSQEFWPLKVTSGVTRRTMPTELERQGDFSRSLDVNNRLVVVSDPASRLPFAGNVVPRSRINSDGQALLTAFPLPNAPDRSVSLGAYNYVFDEPQETPQRTETLKLDYHVNSNNILSLNYTHRIQTEHAALGIGSTDYDQFRQRSINDGRVWILRYQKIFNPTLINELNVSFSTRPWNNYIDPEDLPKIQREPTGFRLGQFSPENNPMKLVPNTLYGGISNAARTAIEGRTPNRGGHKIFAVSNNLTKTVGGHTIRTGFYLDRYWDSGYMAQNAAFNGSFDFSRNVNNPLDTGYAYATAILGVFNSYTESTSRPFQTGRTGNIEWFAQDNWRVNSRLTLDCGMRFYWLPQSRMNDDRVAGFLPGRYNPARAVKLIRPAMNGNQRVGVHPVTGQILPATLIGAIADGTGDPANGMISHSFDPSVPGSLMEDSGVHLAPRIGFAYDVFGNGRTALRGGFGVFYNRMATGMVLRPLVNQTPIVESPIVYFGEMTSLLGSKGVLFPTDVLGVDPQGKIPQAMNFSLTVQQNVGWATVVEVGYVGSLGRRLLWARNLNAIPFGANFDRANVDATTGRPLAPSFLRQYSGYNNVTVYEPGASSNYHSLQVTANRRFARGLEFGTSWTWSKAMDFNDNDNNAVSTLVPVRVWNYGLAGFDRTHIVRVNWLYDLPSGPWTNPLLKNALNGWQLSGIASFISGQPTGVGFSTTTAVDITGSPTDGARVVVTGNPVLPKSERTFDRYFNTAVFQRPAAGTVGNSAKTLLRRPGVNNFDLAFYKNFPLHERVRFQIRWELYNAWNHSQFNGLDTAARFDPTGAQVNQRLGQITSARPSRRMQFALRITF